MTTKDGVKLWDHLSTVGICPGYRFVSLTLGVNRGTADGDLEAIEVNLDQEATRMLLRDLLELHEVAWNNGELPLDHQPHDNPIEGQLLKFLNLIPKTLICRQQTPNPKTP